MHQINACSTLFGFLYGFTGVLQSVKSLFHRLQCIFTSPFQCALVWQLVIQISRSYWSHSIGWSLLHNNKTTTEDNMQWYWRTVNYDTICVKVVLAAKTSWIRVVLCHRHSIIISSEVFDWFLATQPLTSRYCFAI